jgi:hypothetical protein
VQAGLARNLLYTQHMRLRITTTTDGDTTVVQVHGQLVGRGVAELGKTSREAGRPLALDLSNLQWVDADGIRLVTRLVDEGAKLRRVSPYVEMLLARQ